MPPMPLALDGMQKVPDRRVVDLAMQQHVMDVIWDVNVLVETEWFFFTLDINKNPTKN